MSDKLKLEKADHIAVDFVQGNKEKAKERITKRKGYGWEPIGLYEASESARHSLVSQKYKGGHGCNKPMTGAGYVIVFEYTG